MPNVQEPKLVEKDRTHGDTYEHPAFGQIRVNRVSGRAHLFGSDFTHQHYVIVEIETCQLVRSLNRDRYHGDKPLIRVAMSEAQWAAFVSSMGRQGAPCTIERRGFESIPELPAPVARPEQFSGEMRGKLAKVVERLKSAAANAKTVSHRKEIEGAIMELTSNVDFIAESFDEHMEGTVEAAKAEVHGYINHTIERAGLQALTGGQPPFALETRHAPALEDHSQEKSQ
jgi:hypothetical protein